MSIVATPPLLLDLVGLGRLGWCVELLQGLDQLDLRKVRDECLVLDGHLTDPPERRLRVAQEGAVRGEQLQEALLAEDLQQVQDQLLGLGRVAVDVDDAVQAANEVSVVVTLDDLADLIELPVQTQQAEAVESEQEVDGQHQLGRLNTRGHLIGSVARSGSHQQVVENPGVGLEQAELAASVVVQVLVVVEVQSTDRSGVLQEELLELLVVLEPLTETVDRVLVRRNLGHGAVVQQVCEVGREAGECPVGDAVGRRDVGELDVALAVVGQEEASQLGHLLRCEGRDGFTPAAVFGLEHGSSQAFTFAQGETRGSVGGRDTVCPSDRRVDGCGGRLLRTSDGLAGGVNAGVAVLAQPDGDANDNRYQTYDECCESDSLVMAPGQCDQHEGTALLSSLRILIERIVCVSHR